MKKLTLITAIFIAVGANAQSVKKTLTPAKFTKLDISSALNVEYVKGNIYKVEINAPERYLENVKVTNKGDVLVLKLECQKCNTKNGESFDIVVMSPQIDEVEVSGACSFTSKATLDGSKLKLDVNGASNVNLNLKVDYLDLDVNGASSAKLMGTAKKVDADINGASSFKGQDLKVETMKIECEGVSSSKVNVSGDLAASSSGMSSINNSTSAKKQKITSDSDKNEE
jgi:Putative auto-transporter adhesin, head GIN domain